MLNILVYLFIYFYLFFEKLALAYMINIVTNSLKTAVLG